MTDPVGEGRNSTKTYLGDAVMVEFDGHGLMLSLDDGSFQKIYLEPEVYRALTEYVDRLRQTHFPLPGNC